jgi:acetyl-CoA carboxylase biotin carboxyl carrier protein
MSENVGSAKAEERQQEQGNQGNRGRHRRHNNPQKKKHGEPSLNLAEIRELADLVDAHGFTDFEYENENIRIRLSKHSSPQLVHAVQPVQSIPVSAPASASAAETKPLFETAPTEADSDADLHKITSPIVGTFYRSPSPDKDSYVKEGSQVSADSVVCIVEAMKLMNEIQAEVSGEVVKIYVENGQPVEYGQPLFGIKK